jgi:hypothetical protein
MVGANGWHLMPAGSTTVDIANWINSLGLADVFYVTQDINTTDIQVYTPTAHGFTTGSGNIFEIVGVGGWGMGLNWDNPNTTVYEINSGGINASYNLDVAVVNPIQIKSICEPISVNPVVIDSITKPVKTIVQTNCTGEQETYWINGNIGGGASFTAGTGSICSYHLIVLEGEVLFSANGVPAPFNYLAGYDDGANYPQRMINQFTIIGQTPTTKAVIKIIR